MKAHELAAKLMSLPNDEVFFDGLGRGLILQQVSTGSLRDETEKLTPVVVIELDYVNPA